MVGFYSLDLRTGVNHWSPELKTLLGLSPDEPVTLERLAATLHVEDRSSFLAVLQRSLIPPEDGSLERAFIHEHPFVGSDGGTCHVLLHGRTSFHAQGGVRVPACAIGVAIDITQERALTDQLRASEERFRLATEAIAGMIYDWDVASDHCLRSEGLARLLGIAPGTDEPTGKWWAERLHPDDLAHLSEEWTRIADGGPTSLDRVYRVRHASGRWIWLRDRMRIVRDATGRAVRCVGASKDVTAEIEAEESIRELTRQREEAIAQFQALVRAAPVGITMLDLEQRFQLINDRLAGMNGVPAPDHIGKTIADVVPKLAPVVRPYFEQVVRSGKSIEDVMLEGETSAAPGVRRVWSESWFPVPGPDGRTSAVGVIVQDVTEQRAAEESLRRSEARFRALTHSIPQIVWTCDPLGACTYVSSQWSALTGQSDQEAMGYGWVNIVHPDDRARQRELWSHSLGAGTTYECDVRLRMADGSYRWFLARALPWTRADGSIEQWIGTSTDIEDRKQAEAVLNRDREALEQLVAVRTAELEESHRRQRLQERLTHLGMLAAGLGHDIGNLLIPVRMRLECLESEALPSTAREDVQAIRAACDYAHRLAAGLRLLAVDPAAGPPDEETCLDQWWHHVEPLLRTTIPAAVTLVGSVAGKQLSAHIGMASLTQIAFNLVQNAGEAFRQRGSGRVTIDARAEGSSVVISFQDDGPGMDERVRQHCLDPFFTTKSRPHSTGLGLALVHSAVLRAGGSLDVVSEVGKGACFTIRLPRVEPEPRRERTRRAAVRVSDPQLRSFIEAELKALECEIIGNADEQPLCEICVADTAAEVPRNVAAAVMIHQPPWSPVPANVQAIGPVPTPRQIREALRRAVTNLGDPSRTAAAEHTSQRR